MKTIDTIYGKVKAEIMGKRYVTFGGYERKINVYKDEAGRMFGRIACAMREIHYSGGVYLAANDTGKWFG